MDTLDRPDIYMRGETVVYRASAFGHCLIRLARIRQGFEPLAAKGEILDVFRAGHEAERQVFAKAIVSGRTQDFVGLHISDTIMIAGHLDSWEEETISEIKSHTEDEYGKPAEELRLWPVYAWQISVYMHATKLPLKLVRVLRDKDGNIGEHKIEMFDVPPKSMAEIRQRVFEVEMLARRDLREVKCEVYEYPCPVYYTHPDSDAEIREYVESEEATVLTRQYQNARIVAQAANSRVDASRKALLAWMGDKAKMELPDGTLLTKYHVAGKRVEYDRKEYEALRVSKRKDKDERDDESVPEDA